MSPKHIALIVGILAASGGIGYAAFAHAPEQVPVTEQSPVPSAGKINVDAVCRGALAYMTFPDGASADAFVEECREGKHPEVIERYKADMNLGAGAAI
jgi:hypothetical protein